VVDFPKMETLCDVDLPFFVLFYHSRMPPAPYLFAMSE